MPNLESEVEDMVKAEKPEEEIKAVIEGAGPVIYGCTDPTSLNYNTKATDDDGSCLYPDAKEDAQPTLLETKEEVIEEDPYEAFYVKPSFFGEATEDGGTKNKPSEKEAAKKLNEKLSGLGIKVIEDKAGFNAIKIIGGEKEEDIDLGLWKDFWTFDDETPKQKADKLNAFINDVIKHKQEENPLFNIDTYVGAMQKAKADKPEVWHLTKEGGRFLTVEELSFEQLNDHTHRVHLNLMNDYFKSDEGKTNIKIINEQKTEVRNRLWEEAVKKIMLGEENSLDVSKQYIEQLDAAYDEIYGNNASYQQMLTNTTSVVGSLFNDRLLDKKYREGIKEEFGGFVASSDILTAFAKGATVIFPKEIQEFKGIKTNETLNKLNKQLSKLNKLNDDDIAYGSYFTNDEEGRDVNFPGKNYKVSDLKAKLLSAITYNEMKFVGNMLKAEEYKKKLDLITKPNSELFTKDGRLNITSDNWQLAIGDQGFRMMSSIFSGGMTTLVAEAGGAYSQILEGRAQQKYGDAWAGMDKHQKAIAYLDIINAGEADFQTAMTVGGINMTLENISNVFFVSKVAKPAVAMNIKGYFELFMKGKIRQGLTDISKNVAIKDGLKVLGPTLVEVLTESGQDIVTQYNVGTALDNYSHSWNETANAALTAAVTTPFLFGGGKAANVVYTEVSSRIAAIKNPKAIIDYARKQKAAYLQQLYLPEGDPNKISQKEYDERMVQIDGAEKMFSETDKVVTDPEAVKMLLEAQIEINKQLDRVRKLESDIAKAKKENPGYDEELDVVGQDELNVAIAKIRQQEQIKNIAKRKDSYKTKVRDAANEINSDPIKSKDFEAKVFNTTQEALDYLEREYGVNLENNPGLVVFKEGGSNAITINPDDMKKILGEDYTGKGVVFWSDQAIVDGIDKGDRFSANALVHEKRAHVDLYYKSDEELFNTRSAILDILKASKSPQMQEIRKVIFERLMQYEKKFGKDYLETRDGVEEFFAAISDATSVLSTDALTKEDRQAILEIGEELSSFIDGTVVIDGDWNVDNTLEFTQSMPGGNINVISETYFDENGNIIKTVDSDNQIIEDTKNSLKEGRQADLILLEDSNPYSLERSNAEIDVENKRLNKLIEKNETFVHPKGDLVMQEKIRKEGGKKYRDQLFFNNYGQFKILLKAYKDDHALHTDERKEFFIGEAMEQFVKALSTYNRDKQGNYQMKNDSFSAYYFGDPKDKNYESGLTKDGRSIAKLRLVKIWEDMKAKFTIQLEDMTGEESMSDYDQNYVLGIQDKINDYNERSVLREGLSSLMEFDVDGPMYTNFVGGVSESLVDFNFENIFDPNASQVMRKKGMNLWRGFKKFMELDLSKDPKIKDNKIFKGGQPTQFYINLITDNIETYYNQLDQKTFNDIFIEHTEIIINEDTNPVTGRLTVEGSKKGKGIKSKTAGNVNRKKKKFTPEIEAAILEQLLKTDQIAQLTAEGKTNAEIHEIIRIDMVQQSTLKNFTDILFKDAAMQVITSEEFKKKNGISASETAQMALLMDKGIDAKFSLVDGSIGEINANIGSVEFLQQVARLTRSIDNYTDHNEYEAVIDFIQADELAPQSIKDFVSTMYNKGLVDSAGEKKFKSFTVNNENIDKKLRNKFNEGGNIRFNKDARDNMVKNASVLTKIFGKEFMEAGGFEFLGFRSGDRYLNIKGKRKGSEKGEYFTAYNDLVSGLKSVKEEDLPGGLTYEDLANVRMMNVMAGTKDTGIFKKLITILESDMTKAEKLAKIQDDGLGAEIDAANEANAKMFKTIITTIAEQVKDGNVDEVAILEMFKMQSNLVQGFRGMSRLDGYLVLDGSQKGTKWKGEHTKSMSEVNAQIVDLIYRYKKNPKGINLDTEIDLILTEYSQILGEKQTFDILDIPGQTNVAGINRLAYLSDAMLKGITNHNNESVRDVQARLYAQRITKEDIIKSQLYDEANLVPEVTLVEDEKAVVNPVEYDDQGTKFSLGDTFNKVLEDTEGMRTEIVFSEAQAKIRGKKSGGVLDVIYPASAYDFEMFTYKYTGKGELGEQQAAFFKEKLFDPYELAIQEIDKKKQIIRNDYKALVKELPQVRKNLKKNIEGTNYTIEQAIRVYTWSKNGIEIPGLSKRDQKALIKVVEADQELVVFANKLSAISRQKEGYTPPSEYWTIEGISYDLTEMTGKVGRAKALAQWKENVNQIFSEDNKNKLRVLYGNDHVEALEDMLYRMEYGRNKSTPGRIESQWNNWVNNSVGAIMFFNMRSAALQTISAANYMDWKNNNPAKAALAFANQPQYWKDFSYIFNSDYLKERRAGNKRTINEAELSAHLKGSTNKAKAAIAWLLEKGFLPTQIADSFAIASGGASYYRNQIKAYEKEGMSTKEAETQAFLDFRQKTEYGQQSSRPDLISQQQAGGLGRLILAFKNTPMQYNRLMIKAMADLKNGRGSTRENMSKIAYYGAVQNIIFSSLQTALFSAIGDEDEWDTKKERIANSMIDSVLNGMGLTGAIAVTIKNGYLQYRKQKKRGRMGDQTYTVIQFANLSPTIGSKLRKLYGSITTEQYNKEAIEEMGFNLENPAFNSLANLISATTNIPLDRAVQKAQNIILASKSETEAMDSFALLMGYNPWDLGLETEAKKVKKEVRIRKEKEKKQAEFNLKEEQGKEKQKREEKEGKQITCLVCKLPVVKGKKYCTRHEKVPQRKDGAQVQCKKIKSNKQRCKVMTANKSGLCYYHD